MSQIKTLKISFLNFVLWSIITLALGSCSSPTEIVPTQLRPTQIRSPTPTIQPSSTPTIPIVIFIPPVDDFLNLAEPIRSTLLPLVSQEGWSMVERDSIASEFLSDDVRVVVAFEPIADIIDLASSNPEVQFVSIGAAGVEPEANISVIGPDGLRYDQHAFLGGYLSAILTPDWRTGEIVEAPSDFLPTIASSFRNGVKFFCGLCLLSYPPFNDYPIYTSVGPETLESDWLSSIELLQSNAVETVFLYVREIDLSVVRVLIENEILLIGINPPPESINSNWIATIRLAPEQVLMQQWEKILSSEGGWVEYIPFVLEDVNQTLLSEGKQRFFNLVIQDVVSGYIDPSVTPIAPIENE